MGRKLEKSHKPEKDRGGTIEVDEKRDAGPTHRIWPHRIGAQAAERDPAMKKKTSMVEEALTTYGDRPSLNNGRGVCARHKKLAAQTPGLIPKSFSFKGERPSFQV